MSKADFDALTKMIDRRIAFARRHSVDRPYTVQAVNDDGTVNLDVGFGNVAPSQPALTSYTPRNVGDVVLARMRGAEFFVLGDVGAANPSPPTPPTITVSDVAAPAGVGWEQIVSGQLWARSSGLWCKRIVVAPPPPPGGTVTRVGATFTTYRGGAVTQSGVAEQGDFTGRGLQTGLVTFGVGAWAALAGKTCTGGTLTIHRSPVPHGFSYGPQTAIAWRALVTDPTPTPPTLIDGAQLGQAALNQSVAVAVDAGWVQAFAAGTASAVVFYSVNAGDNVQIVANLTLSINYS